MKKFAYLLPLVLLFAVGKVSAQTISAAGKSITLNKYDIAYLREFNNPQIDAALSLVAVKYNDTADMIIALIEKARAERQQDFVLADVTPRRRSQPLR